MAKTTRRSFLAGMVSIGAAAAAGLRFQRLDAAEPQPLRIPELIDGRAQANGIALKAQHGRTAFFGSRESATRGFNGNYLGPTLRLHRGDEVEISVTNAMRDPTAVHWHGLLIPAEFDGGPHQMIQPGATWRPRLKINQPAATLWYHAHPHGSTARQVYAGLAGMIIVSDEDEALGLPSNYGVDDLPVILQDKVFDEYKLVYPDHPMVVMQGLRGETVLVNGTSNAVARVPAGVVRLRLLNGSNARVYDLSFSDGRVFHWIASDGGLLARPVERRSLWLAPGQRAEILVDLSDARAVDLRTGPDPSSLGGMMGAMRDPLNGPVRFLRLEPQGANIGTKSTIPASLVQRERPDPARAVRRRQLRLTMGMGGMMGGTDRRMGRGMMGGMFGIDGRPFNMDRVDQTVRLGDTEIWEVTGDMMTHPFHIHGVHFEVLSRAGSRPAMDDQGPRDTVLVREPVEILVRFTEPAERTPFMFHCHTLEHEDAGMMGQYTAA
ncbi:MAG TPA: multicopper oxidase domain-containing protein [Chloroflexota bacterium]|nr:multicopper oxidase domain-containing protein [Chloroflexota bacterium]